MKMLFVRASEIPSVGEVITVRGLKDLLNIVEKEGCGIIIEKIEYPETEKDWSSLTREAKRRYERLKKEGVEYQITVYDDYIE